MNEQRLIELFDAYVDRRLSPQEKAELESALLASDEARKLFWSHVSIHGLAHEAAKLKWSQQPAEESRPGFLDWLGQLLQPRWILAGAAAAVVVVAAFVFHFGQTRPSALPVARNVELPKISGPAALVSVHGRVVISRNGSDSDGAENGPLQPGDSIRVVENSSAHVLFADGTLLRLEPGASLRLGGDELKNIELNAGRLFAKVAKQADGKHVELRTPLANVTVHGTEFSLDAESRATRLDVSEGLVRIAHAQRDSAMEIAGGEFAVAMANSDLVGGIKPVVVKSSHSATDGDFATRPFASDSPWNRAIGTKAQFADIKSEALDFANNGAAVMPVRLDRTLIIAKDGDPEISISQRYVNEELVRLRCAPDAFASARNEGSCVVIDPRGFAHEMSHVARDGDSIAATTCVSNDLRGAGMPPENVGTSMSGLPLVAGIIREGELKSGIHHALSGTVLHSGLSREGGAFAWPARHAPIEQKMIDRMGASGNVHYGTLLAIPRDVDVSKIGVSGAALEIAKALQNHGAYVTHSYGASPNPGWKQPHIQFYADGVADDELRELMSEVSKLAPYLKVVANNGPAAAEAKP